MSEMTEKKQQAMRELQATFEACFGDSKFKAISLVLDSNSDLHIFYAPGTDVELILALAIQALDSGPPDVRVIGKSKSKLN